MRVLHTADWHLGQRLQSGHDRHDEHQRFLHWLTATIAEQRVEVLVVAGDVFDTGNPPSAALELYYSFLVGLRATGCRDVVIVGGNHDHPATLNAPARLLRHLRVHVVGCVPECFEEQIFTLENAQGQPGLVVCAVPFLRDRDVRLSVPGESAAEREGRIRQGIADHYARLAECEAVWLARDTHGLPVLATGHLYAAGGAASDSERTIHVGNLGQVTADHFPEIFDYVALGHLHRPQQVGGRAHIRYCGSPIPLSFSERLDAKQVLLLEFEGAAAPRVEVLPVPVARRLVRVQGTLPEVLADLLAYENATHPLPAWVDVEIHSDLAPAEVSEQLAKVLDLLDRQQLEVLQRRHLRLSAVRPLGAETEEPETPLTRNLHEFSAPEVFAQRLESEPEDGRAVLQATFAELLELMHL
ncbi:exonuclease subunit SbcD [Hymenobacter daeguensis]